MEGFQWILVENIVFFVILLYIIIMKNKTPIWIYTFLGAYIVYLGLRFMFSKQGTEFAVLWIVANSIVLLGLLYNSL